MEDEEIVYQSDTVSVEGMSELIEILSGKAFYTETTETSEAVSGDNHIIDVRFNSIIDALNGIYSFLVLIYLLIILFIACKLSVFVLSLINKA